MDDRPLGRFAALIRDGVALSDLVSLLRRRWRRVAAWSLITALIAYGIAWILPAWYASGASLIVDAGESPSTTNLGGLAGVALGLGLSGDQSNSPEFYVSLLRSRSVGEALLATDIPLADGSHRTLLALWSGDSAPSREDREHALEKLERHLSASADPRTGIITFTVEGPNEEAAKVIADRLLSLLNHQIIDIRTTKAANQRRFLEGRFAIAQDSLRGQEDKLRQFLEHNQNSSAPRLVIERARLQRLLDRYTAVHQDLARQLEQARFAEVRNTPAVVTIDQPVVPIKRSSPRRSLIAAVGLILGAGVALLTVLLEAVPSRHDPASPGPATSPEGPRP